ncbi:MAG: alanine racemase, partial [Gemmatimonadota bacterium]
GAEPLAILVQVNASGEETKSGLTPETAPAAVAEIAGLPGLRVEGLMTMAPFTDDRAVLRETFRATRRTLECCEERTGELRGRVLSMGMSNDYEVAVEEGSTRVRLGTVLLGERTE